MPNFICKQCGRSFPHHPGNPGRERKYCGHECAWLGARTASFERKYAKVRADGHPLAETNGMAFEHRLILWDKIGPGSHPCHHCGVTVTWAPGRGAVKGALVTDHLDRNRKNNSPDNLVPSCSRCNSLNRAVTVTDDEAHIVRANGQRLRGERRTCATCNESFVAWPGDRQKRIGIYCSPECMRKRNPPPAPCTCQRCGREFVRRYVKESKYCSQTCYQAAPKVRDDKAPNRTCGHCGGPFWTPTWREKKYCGLNCYHAARAQERRERLREKATA